MLPWIAENTFSALLLAGLAVPLCLLARFRPAICHMIWLLVLVRLVAPPLPFETWTAVDLAGWVTPAAEEADGERAAERAARPGDRTATRGDRPDATTDAEGVRLPVPRRESLWEGPGKGPPVAWLGDRPEAREKRLAEEARMQAAQKQKALAAAGGTGGATGGATGGEAGGETAGELTDDVARGSEDGWSGNSYGESAEEERAEFVLPSATRPIDGPGAAATASATAPTSGRRLLTLAGEVALWVWLAGGLFVLARQTRRALRFQRLVRDGRPAPGELCALVADVARRLDVPVPPVRLLPALGSPVVWSLGRPVLLWPADARGRAVTTTSARGIVAHELAHLARRDHWVAWFEVAATALLWWHPLFWFARGRMHTYAELSCDAWAVWAYPHGRRDYAEALIDVAERMSAPNGPAPVLAVIEEEPREFERRLRMIMRERVSRRVSPVAAAAAVLATTFLLPVGSMAQDGWDDPEKQGVKPKVELSLAVQEAAALSSAGKWEQAAKAWKGVLAADEHNGEAAHWLGYSLHMTGDYEGSLKAWTHQRALGWEKANAEYNIACAHAKLGNEDGTLQHLVAAIQCGFDDKGQIEGDGDLDLIRHGTHVEELFAAIDDVHAAQEVAQAAVQAADWHAAADAYGQLTRLTPEVGEPWHMQAYALIGLGEYEPAVASCERQIALGYRPETGHYNIACARALQGDTEAAFASLKTALEAGFNDAGLLASDPDLDGLRGDPRMEKLEARLASVSSQHSKASAHTEKGEWTDAVREWAGIAEEHQADGYVASELGIAKFRKGDYEGALAAFTEQVEAGDAVDKGLYNMACAHAMLGHEDDALEYLGLAIDAGLDDAELIATDTDLGSLHGDPRLVSYVNRAADVAQLKAFDAVSWEHLLELTSKRAQEDPNDGQAWHRMGWACLRLGKYDQAVKAFTAQKETGFSTQTATYNLACSYALMDQPDPAFEWLGAAIDEGFLDVDLLVSDPDLTNLRGDPRFEKIAKHMKQIATTGRTKSKKKEKDAEVRDIF